MTLSRISWQHNPQAQLFALAPELAGDLVKKIEGGVIPRRRRRPSLRNGGADTALTSCPCPCHLTGRPCTHWLAEDEDDQVGGPWGGAAAWLSDRFGVNWNLDLEP